MKTSRRKLLGILVSIVAFPKVAFCASYPKPGDFKIYSSEMETSGLLKLSDMDVLMKVSTKEIHGDGHSHKVPLSKKAWGYLSKGQALLVRTDVDSAGKNHSHWIKVYS